MGRIFGISDNPVTTIESSLRILNEVPKPPVRIIKRTNVPDQFVPSSRKAQLNPFIKMRNGIGRLMKHFKSPQS